MSREAYLLRTYGITETDYLFLEAANDGGCWICGRKPTGRRLHVEHNHKQKGRESVRGLCCWPCNKGLKDFRDNPEFLRRAALYLEGSLYPRLGGLN